MEGSERLMTISVIERIIPSMQFPKCEGRRENVN